jgi:hypothetical protein
MSNNKPVNKLPIINNPSLSGYTIYEDLTTTSIISIGELVNLVIDGSDLYSIVSAETISRISGDTILYNMITGETSDRLQQDIILHNEITGITETVGENYTVLYDLISGETYERIIGDENLQNKITGLTYDFTSHTGNTDNPHVVTAQQIGVYTTGQTNEILLGKSNTGHTHDYLPLTGGTINGNLIIESGFTINGDGSGLNNIPASGVTGLNLDRITSGENSAIMSSSGLTINTGITATNLSGTNTGDERYTNLTPTDSTIGGIPIGSTFSGKTVTQMFDSLLYPTLNPTLTNPSSTFTVSVSTYYEIGQLISLLTFNSSFNRGTINPAYGTSGYRSGLPTQYNYGGSGLSNVVSSGLTNSVSISNYTVLNGTNSWTGNVTYSAGEQPLTNKGDNYSTPLSSGTTNTITRSFTGIYPFLYGMSDLILDTNNSYTTLTGKLIEVQGNKTVTLNGDLKYIYFIYPATYSNLVSIIDQNGFNVTGSFQQTTMNVTSSGLGTNWTTSYKIYRTINMTTVLNGQYQFKFS